MTREEEIQIAAEEHAIYTNDERLNAFPEATRPQLSPEYNSDDLADAFDAGAKWADRHPDKKHTETIKAYMARDTGNLVLYERMPTKMGYFYVGGFWTILPDEFFPNITCENGIKKVKITIELEEEE